MRQELQQRRCLALTGLGLLMSVVVLPVWAAPPSITSISFPSNIETQATAYGQINYQDPDGDVTYARFDVADGRYVRVTTQAPTKAAPDGQMYFRLSCTPFAQQITLAVTLWDAAGEESKPAQLTFTCGQPPLYDFDAEQTQVLPISMKIPLNVFVLEDGETALTEGASLREGDILGDLRPEVFEAVRTTVSSSLTGIWDQCGVGFELAGAWAVKPERLQIMGEELGNQVFQHEASSLVIHHGQQVGELLREATLTLLEAAEKRDARAAGALNVLVVGARILTMWEGSPMDIEGFSASGMASYAVIRWGTVLEGVTPKQMISTLAHEIGHLLGLPHPYEAGPSDALADPMNLMMGSGVSPEPRAHFLPSQCRMTDHALTQIQLRATEPGTTPVNPGEVSERALTEEALMQAQLRMPEPTAAPAPTNPTVTQSSTAVVRWLSLCPENLCSGEVSLSIDAEGFPDLESFSFALFEYSVDGEHFVEIGVDRISKDGFSILWDTTKMPDGLYTLRASVTDARGVRATVLAQVRVRNDLM